MIRKTFLFIIVLALAAFTFAQDAKKSSAKITGYLVDSMCAGEHGEDDAKEHAVSCALMPGCARSGFVVVAKDKHYKLDAHGNEEAAKVLNATKTKKGLKVEVEGTIEGETLHVEKLAEVN
jgi:hypothetical protein